MIDHKLKLFCSIVQTGSFSKAAEITGLTQPGVSRQIQTLEDVYNARLLNRQGGTVTLTKAGERLYKYAEEINSHFTIINNKLRSLSSSIDKTIRVGSCHTIGNFVLPEVASNFNKQYSDITIDLSIDDVDDILNTLHERKIDLAFVNGNIKNDNLIVKKLFSDELVLIMLKSHKLSANKNISILDIMNEPFIMNSKCASTKMILENYLSNKGLSINNLRTVLKTGTIESAKRAVKNGMGVSIIPRCAVTKDGDNGKTTSASFREGKLTNNYSLIYRKNRDYPPVSSKFIKYISNYPFQQSK